METVKLNGTTIQGGGLKYAITPQIVLGDKNNGFEPGTILDANCGTGLFSVKDNTGILPGNWQFGKQLELGNYANLVIPGHEKDTKTREIIVYSGQSNVALMGSHIINGTGNVVTGSAYIGQHYNIVTASPNNPAKILNRELVDGVPTIKIDVKADSTQGKAMLQRNFNIAVNIKYDEKTGAQILNPVDFTASRSGGTISATADGYIQVKNQNLGKLYYDQSVTHMIYMLTNVSGRNNLAAGFFNSIEGSASCVVGQANAISSNGSFCAGNFGQVFSSWSQAMGDGIVVYNYAEHGVGCFNKSTSLTGTTTQKVQPTGDARKKTTLFSIGNGTSNDARSNALEIKYNGDMYLNDGRKVQDVLPQTPAATRPANPVLGQMFFDTTKNKPLWFGKDDKWVDANGTVVA